MAINLKEAEENILYEEDSPKIPPPDIIAYNELRSCADLYRMQQSKEGEPGVLNIQPEFEREIVWKGPDQTRFIDSLIKKMPIPSMCFSLDYKTEKWQVIDGLQRIATIIRFLSDKNWTLSKLDDIDPKIAGKPVSEFIDRKSPLHLYYTRVENLTLPITVLRCDYSKKPHTEYLFTIFRRLNTGGMKLNNQEIRNCIYGGSFNKLLKELDKNQQWMEINKMKSPEGYRFTKQELILRLFTFNNKYEDYNGKLASFLSNYMRDNKDIDAKSLNEKRILFERTVKIIYEKIFKSDEKLSITVLEALLVGVSFNLDSLEHKPKNLVRSMYNKLRKHEEFSEQSLSEGLAGKSKVIDRLFVAKEIFAGN